MSTGPCTAPYDMANPPAGVRLMLGLVAVALKVSVSDMAAATGLARSTFHGLLSNDWPARASDKDKADARAALADLFARRGATPEQLATLWHAHGRRPHANDATTDGYGRPRNYVAAKPKTKPAPQPPPLRNPKCFCPSRP